MKKKLHFKNLVKHLLLSVLAMILISGCEKEEDDPINHGAFIGGE